MLENKLHIFFARSTVAWIILVQWSVSVLDYENDKKRFKGERQLFYHLYRGKMSRFQILSGSYQTSN